MKILVCLDGEPHTHGAIERAIELARSESAEVVGLHVIDEWLRQFSSKIYAQGRQEYLEWVDQCLEEKASRVRESFVARCHAHDVTARFVLRDGDRTAEIVAVAHELAPDLVITGGRELTRWERFRSGKLPERLRKAVGGKPPIEIVRQPTAHLRPASRVTDLIA